MKVLPQFNASGRLTHLTLWPSKTGVAGTRREHIAEERLEAYVGNRLGAKIREDAAEVYESLQQERQPMVHRAG